MGRRSQMERRFWILGAYATDNGGLSLPQYIRSNSIVATMRGLIFNFFATSNCSFLRLK